ncbi:MAG TPA: hypothetical protein VNR61_09170 [Niallia sp.]|nr:hypothetical protein [Niallia sp.]
MEILNISELGNELNKMYSNAPHGEQVAHIHLFGIKNADEISRNHLLLKR